MLLNSFKPLLSGRKKSVPDSAVSSDSIKDVCVDDVFTVTGLSVEYEDSYFIVERVDRYESDIGQWHEILGSDGNNKLWLQWSDADGIQISAMADGRPVGLSVLNLDDSDLERMDHEHSIDNSIIYGGVQFYYQQSSEAFHFPDGTGPGKGFYLWEFAGGEGAGIISVVKWESMPFQVYFSEVVPLENVTVYKR